MRLGLYFGMTVAFFITSALTASSTPPPLGADTVDARCAERAAVEHLAHGSELREVRLSHEKAIRELRMQLDSRTAELERLRRTCTCSSASVEVPQQAGLSLPFGNDSDTGSGRGPKSGDVASVAREVKQGANRTLQVSRPTVPVSAAGRELLRSTTAPPHCSKEEMRTVLNASPQSRAGAVKDLLMTNTLCGMCILERVSAPIPDILLEIQSCTHQEENRCDASTGLSRIVSLIPVASIQDRASIFRMVDVVEAGMSNAAASSIFGTVSILSVH
jgi:hypothetical protein